MDKTQLQFLHQLTIKSRPHYHRATKASTIT